MTPTGTANLRDAFTRTDGMLTTLGAENIVIN
jgi:hypothetical protein